MIGCSRPMMSRLMADLIKLGEIARRGRLYILLNDGAIAANVRNASAMKAPSGDLRVQDVGRSGRRGRAAFVLPDLFDTVKARCLDGVVTTRLN